MTRNITAKATQAMAFRVYWYWYSFAVLGGGGVS
jgi:hypothetical protein